MKKVSLVLLLAFTGCTGTKNPSQDSATKTAPTISAIVWGTVTVSDNGKTQTFGDAKVYPNGAKEWDWKAHTPATRHNPGIQIADIEEFITGANEVDIIILTRGMDLVLQIPQATIDHIKSKGKICHDGETKAMVKLYNELVAQGKKVGGVFHSTC